MSLSMITRNVDSLSSPQIVPIVAGSWFSIVNVGTGDVYLIQRGDTAALNGTGFLLPAGSAISGPANFGSIYATCLAGVSTTLSIIIGSDDAQNSGVTI